MELALDLPSKVLFHFKTTRIAGILKKKNELGRNFPLSGKKDSLGKLSLFTYQSTHGFSWKIELITEQVDKHKFSPKFKRNLPDFILSLD